ncbi:peptide chain release factor N(5)-glutamine methyltransferase [Candidatus Sumerlaeota bacterium]|nr:peptide chain release factor N(5)-glutamine methyltransferase [Candidatus Sumerlaeota bacterium]
MAEGQIPSLSGGSQETLPLSTVSDAIAEAARLLSQHGISQSRFEAEVLLAKVMVTSRTSFYTWPEQSLTAEQQSLYRELLRRRAEGEPVAYLCGEKEFFSLRLLVNRSVLIPRPETEHVVETALGHLGRVAEAGREPIFFDVGTGCGAIAVALLVNLPGCRAIASDVSGAALDLARQNAQRHGVADRLRLIEGDLFGGFKEKVDAVVSNPPYVGEDERDLLPREVRDFEPPEALFAGQDGLTVIRRLIEQSPVRLAAGGALIFEIGYGKDRAVRQLLEADRRWSEIEIRADLAGIPRVVFAQLA